MARCAPGIRGRGSSVTIEYDGSGGGGGSSAFGARGGNGQDRRVCGAGEVIFAAGGAGGQASMAGSEVSVQTAILTRRIAELEQQRDAVLALCDEAERDEPSAVFSQGGPMWSIWTAEIRKAYGERS